MQALNSSRRFLQANRESRLSVGSGRYGSLFRMDLRNGKLKLIGHQTDPTAELLWTIQKAKRYNPRAQMYCHIYRLHLPRY